MKDNDIEQTKIERISFSHCDSDEEKENQYSEPDNNQSSFQENELEPESKSTEIRPASEPKARGLNKKIILLITFIIVAGFAIGIAYGTDSGTKKVVAEDNKISQSEQSKNGMPNNLKDLPSDYKDKGAFDAKNGQTPPTGTVNTNNTPAAGSAYIPQSNNYNRQITPYANPFGANTGSTSSTYKPAITGTEIKENNAIGFFASPGQTTNGNYSNSGNTNSTTPSNTYNDQNMQGQKTAFLGNNAGSLSYLSSGLMDPISEYEVKAGTVIPGLTLTAINSDLPGQITGQVSENVYDTVTGQYLLIPQGTRIIGIYDSQITQGQSRLLIAWTRLIYPNGDSINLEGMSGADGIGQAGLSGYTDNHFGQMMGAALISTVLSAGAQMAGGNTQSYNPTNGQNMAGGAAQAISNVGQQVVSRSMNIQPTIIINPGSKFNIAVNKDMILRPYR
ncbi:MAG: TrbI/VirB10 family protein [Bacillota bacterium]